jgi:hypothetical protein
VRRRIAPAIAVLALVGVACAEPTSPTATTTSGDANEILLQVGYEGGFVAPSFHITNTPSFSLYGDGALIEPGAQTEMYPGQALPALLQRTLRDDAVAAIVQRAREAGLDHDATYTDLGSVAVADAPDTVFTLAVDGQTHSVRVYALGIVGGEDRPDGMPTNDWEARRQLAALLEDLQTIDTWLPAGSISQPTPYVGDAAILLVEPYRPDDQLPPDPIPWPIDGPLVNAGTAVSYDEATRCVVVTGDDWRSVHELAMGANQLTPWTDDGKRFGLQLRPLFPDEPRSCPA